MSAQDIRKLLKDPSLVREDAFINGQWVKSSAKQTFSVNNPATSELIAHVANLGPADAELAIAAEGVSLRSGHIRGAHGRRDSRNRAFRRIQGIIYY